jgi:hypothetical protein
MRRWTWMAVIATTSVALLPAPVAAQTSEAVGIVTTLDGRATVARPAAPGPLALKFKDDVFGRDRISTEERSLVRVLLGGKAILTVRELSQITIHEEPGRAVVTLPDGKVVLAVQKQRMRPGESIEIRTPNAVAAVRGSLMAVSVAGGVTQIICGSGDCFHARAGQPLTPLPPGQQARNGQVSAASASDLNEAFNFRAGTPTFTSPPDSLQAALIQGQTAQATTVAQFLSTGTVPTDTTTSAGGSSGGTGTGTTGCGGPCLPPETSQAIQQASAPPPASTGGGNGTPGDGGGLTKGPNLLADGGFESGLQGWTLTGSGGTIAALGTITPPEGQAMGLIYSSLGVQQGAGLGPTLNPALPPYTDSSKLTQSFAVTGNTLYVIKTTYNFFSNEYPTQSTIYDDRLELSVTDPAGNTKVVALERRNASFTPSTVSAQTATAGGFTIFQGNGVTGFKSFTQSWVPTTSGQATYAAQVGDVTDQSVQSAVLLDQVEVFADPPLYFVGAGSILSRTGADALVRFTGQPQAFDSLIAVCCGGRATLAGPLLRAVDSDLTVPFSLVTLLQGGSLASTSSDPLVSLQGGTHSFGGIGLPIFDVSGVSTATDAGTGLVLGTDRPLQAAGPLFETSGATVNAHQGVRVDTALLEATAPLLALTNGSKLTTAADTVQLSYQAKVTSLGSMVRLDRSALTVASGAALSLAGGSVLGVTGDLFSLTNGSTLSVLNGPLVSLSGGSMLSVNGALVGFGGTGGNLVSVSNSFCPCTTIGGIPVSLTGGALASNVSIAGAIKNAALGTVNLSPNAALIRVDGAGTKVTINGL